MPRNLADVLHHFIPESPPPATASAAAGPHPRATRAPAALPRIAVPVGDRDLVRAAFVWNLAVETARLGACASVVAPLDPGSTLWPGDDVRPLGAEIALVQATNLRELEQAAREVAAGKASPTAEGGLVFVRVPPTWLREPGGGEDLLRWTLLFTSSDPAELLESYGLAKRIAQVLPAARIGVTVHGARRRGEADAAWRRLSDVATRRLRRELTSYGLLVDDLQVYRAIVAQRPIGQVQPQSPAARSMRDVAELLLSDARDPARA
jgi:hypothetical protein